jgi:type IV secretory pathway ATPase VirB11/archaellum biosynthesis ATPase
MVCKYEYDRETDTVRVKCTGCIYGSSIEDNEVCMFRIITILTELKRNPKIILSGNKQYEYSRDDAQILRQIGEAVEKIITNKLMRISNLALPECDKCVPDRYQFLRKFITEFKYDPISAYKKLKREIRHASVKEKRISECQQCYTHYLRNTLKPIQQIVEHCALIKKAQDSLAEHKHRELYRKIFHPTTRPNFMYTQYISIPPRNAELLERYNIGSTSVEIYNLPGKPRKLYHIIPPEFRLTEEEYTLLDRARELLGRHEPEQEPEPVVLRENLYHIASDLLKDISQLSEQKITQLANIVVRYTAGVGILELLLCDDKIQDIAVNSPPGSAPIYIVHEKYGDCETNIVPTRDDAESWATRFRLASGRPLDEANPVLDTELSIPGGRARVTAISKTLSPDDLGFAFRRHRDSPWTYPLFINNRMLDSLTAAMLWFIVDGGRTILIGGTRGSGKTSFLNATMIQIMSKLRIVTLEDTLELNVDYMKKLGYNIERLKSRSVITRVETELPAEEGLRAALRLGDSCLIVGEVRSTEAKALYEAMRIGALANVVAGTIHGASAYGIFDRVVNDLGVPKTSFKATDLIIITNLLKSPDGLSSFRRLTQVTEVRKHWTDDPLIEGGFQDLMEYNAKQDSLKPTSTLFTGESEVLNEISSNIREWKGRWDDVWNNILLRQKIFDTLVSYGNKNSKYLEAEMTVAATNRFHLFSQQVREELGVLDNSEIYKRWLTWLEGTK